MSCSRKIIATFVVAGPLLYPVADIAQAEERDVLRVHLAKPSTRPLNKSEILARLRGSRIVQDGEHALAPGVMYVPTVIGECPTGEDFREDRTWVKHTCGRVPVQMQGRWEIASDRICTTENATKKRACRVVWEGRNPTQVILSDLVAGYSDFQSWTVEKLPVR